MRQFLTTSLLFALGIVLLHSSATASLSPQDCAAAFAQLRFDVSDYDRYAVFYNENSTYTLAEAGSFKGPKAIEEYVRFASASSPYVKSVSREFMKVDFIGLDSSASTCRFLFSIVNNYEMDEKLAVPVTLKNTFGIKVNYSYKLNVISSAFLYFTQAWLRLTFEGFFNTYNIKRFICRTIIKKCPATNRLNGSMKMGACIRKLDALPVLTNGIYFDGFNLGCRVLHAVLAFRNNNEHCAHISFFPETDPKGLVKCQVSEGMKQESFFSKTDLDLWRRTIAEAGINPEIGYSLDCIDQKEWKTPLGDGSGGCNWVRKMPISRCAVHEAKIACAKTCQPSCNAALERQ